jgi:hypothetical protein
MCYFCLDEYVTVPLTDLAVQDAIQTAVHIVRMRNKDFVEGLLSVSASKFVRHQLANCNKSEFLNIGSYFSVLNWMDADPTI